MKTSSLNLLKCNFCRCTLEVLQMIEGNYEDIEWGNLRCINCKSKYPVAYGIPIMMSYDASVDLKRHKTYDNLVKEGPKINGLVKLIASGLIDKAKCLLLSPSLNRTTYSKRTPSDEPINNRLSRKLPKFLVNRINWNYYYRIKWLLAKLSFENFRKNRQEVRLFDQLKKAKSAVDFLRLYFGQNNQMSEYYHYYSHRFSQPNYLVGASLNSIFPLSEQPILDLACGAGHKTHYLTMTKTQACFGLDRDFVSLYVAKNFIAPKGEYICAEADIALPFEDNVFSGVLCSDAFQYFSYRFSAANEMLRVVSKNGVIIVNHIQNSLVYPFEGPEQIEPSQLKELFGAIPKVIVSQNILLERYIKKLGPDLSSEKEIEELNNTMHLSLVASYRDDIFKDYGLLNSWPHAIGKLQLNPLYHLVNEDSSGTTTYKFEFPSEWYEFENKQWLEYAPQQISLNSALKEEINSGSRSLDVETLIDNFIVFGVPDKYCQEHYLF